MQEQQQFSHEPEPHASPGLDAGSTPQPSAPAPVPTPAPPEPPQPQTASEFYSGAQVPPIKFEVGSPVAMLGVERAFIVMGCALGRESDGSPGWHYLLTPATDAAPWPIASARWVAEKEIETLQGG